MKLLASSTAVFCLTLVGCSTTLPPQNPPLPANLSTSCKAAEQLPEGADMGDLLSVATNAAYSLAECSARQKAMVEWADSLSKQVK